jgi:hypothetical protein
LAVFILCDGNTEHQFFFLTAGWKKPSASSKQTHHIHLSCGLPCCDHFIKAPRRVSTVIILRKYDTIIWQKYDTNAMLSPLPPSIVLDQDNRFCPHLREESNIKHEHSQTRIKWGCPKFSLYVYHVKKTKIPTETSQSHFNKGNGGRKRIIEGMNQTGVQYMIYGNVTTNPSPYITVMY